MKKNRLHTWTKWPINCVKIASNPIFKKGQIARNRKQMYRFARNSLRLRSDVSNLTRKRLLKLFKKYDDVLFDGNLRKAMNEVTFKNANVVKKIKLTFLLRPMKKYSTAAGYVHAMAEKKHIHFRFCINKRQFESQLKFSDVGEIRCRDKLECMLRVFEHELTHFMMYLGCIFITNKEGGHARIFQKMVFNLFGLRGIRYGLSKKSKKRNQKCVSMLNIFYT